MNNDVNLNGNWAWSTQPYYYTFPSPSVKEIVEAFDKSLITKEEGRAALKATFPTTFAALK